MPKLFMVVNEDRFFLSHRKPIAVSAQELGYDTTIITKDTGHRKEIEDLGFRVIDLPINPTGMNLKQELKTFGFLLKLYWREQPDIVHHVGMKNILWGGLAARIIGIHGVVNAVSGLGGLFNGGKLSNTTRGILAVMRLSNQRKGIRVIFQNDDDRLIFIENNVVNPDQIELIRGSGIDLNEYVYTPESTNGKINVIFTARMVKEKGVCELIEAAESLKRNYADHVRFLLCGRLTPNKTGITEEYLRQHCDGEYICWLGERNDVKQLLERSHIMAFPSYYREGLPKSLIEACAVGRPIVTCDSTGCRDVVDDGVNGYIVKPCNSVQLADAIKKLIDNPELRRTMGMAARERAEKDFSIEKVIETHLKIYKELSNPSSLNTRSPIIPDEK